MGELDAMIRRLLDRPPTLRSFRAELRIWRDVDRAAAASGLNSEAMSQFRAGLEPHAIEQEERVRLWFVPPDRARIEREACRSGPPLRIRIGSRWWSGSRRGALVSHETGPGATAAPLEDFTPLVEPGPVLALLTLTPRGTTTVAGRSAWRVHATPVTDATLPAVRPLWPLGRGADEYEIEVDRSRGVLLGTLARYEGEPFQVVQVTAVAFDEALPASAFNPDG